MSVPVIKIFEVWKFYMQTQKHIMKKFDWRTVKRF